MANTFTCFIEDKLQQNDHMPDFYRRFVEDILTIMPGINAAASFLNTLNTCHPAIKFTMEIESDNQLPFIVSHQNFTSG